VFPLELAAAVPLAKFAPVTANAEEEPDPLLEFDHEPDAGEGPSTPQSKTLPISSTDALNVLAPADPAKAAPNIAVATAARLFRIDLHMARPLSYRRVSPIAGACRAANRQKG
jgi:hypothetical protein